MTKKYIVINLNRTHNFKLAFLKETCCGYTHNLGKAGLFENIDNLNLSNDDIPVEINNLNFNPIGLILLDIEMSRILATSSDILEISIDIEKTFEGKRIIDILRDIQK